MFFKTLLLLMCFFVSTCQEPDVWVIDNAEFQGIRVSNLSLSSTEYVATITNFGSDSIIFNVTLRMRLYVNGNLVGKQEHFFREIIIGDPVVVSDRLWWAQTPPPEGSWYWIYQLSSNFISEKLR